MTTTWIAEEEGYPNFFSRSPLIRKFSEEERQKIIFATFSSRQHQVDAVIAARLSAEAAVPEVCLVDHTKRLPFSCKLRIVSYFSGGCPRDLASLSAVNKAWCAASYLHTTDVTLVPQYITAEKLEEDRIVNSLTKYLNRETRGQYVENFRVMDSKFVNTLPQVFKGPSISMYTINNILSQLPNLRRLDLRGISITAFNVLNGQLLSSLCTLTPCLNVLSLGGKFVRQAWKCHWWTRLPYLTEFTCGSRREDCDWDAPSLKLTLPEDFFTMLRSPLHSWNAVKVWMELSPESFNNLLLAPTAPFLRLYHLTVNARGNVAARPVGEMVLDTAKDDKKKGGIDKNVKKNEEDMSKRVLFPALQSLTIADVQERPECVLELLGKLAVYAPKLAAVNVTNTHRNAPTHVQPVLRKKGERRA